jgi:hypothetical protein
MDAPTQEDDDYLPTQTDIRFPEHLYDEDIKKSPHKSNQLNILRQATVLDNEEVSQSMVYVFIMIDIFLLEVQGTSQILRQGTVLDNESPSTHPRTSMNLLLRLYWRSQ